MNHTAAEPFTVAGFGRRKVAPRVCIADAKPHIRKFLGEALEEFGFAACGCAEPRELSAMLDGQVPDLVVMGLSAGETDAAAMLKVLVSRSFDGKILLLGPQDSPIVTIVQELGKQLGISMLPALATPFDSEGLRNSVATLVPSEAPPCPEIDAAEALSQGWLELWYQPKYDTQTLRMSGAEALIRVRHPTWGVVPPACFLPDKDDPYLRVLSDFVIGRAIEDWRNFIPHHGGVEIAINLPLTFFYNAPSIASLCRQIPKHPAFKGFIVEIDAADVIDNLDVVKAVAGQLRPNNVAISIDDLGSEWPSLAGLDDFPFVEMKVDRPYVSGCADDRLKQTVCRQILDVADSFGARTVAEGVETRADFFTVRDMGFDLAQGYLFAKPMTAQKFAQAIRRHPVSMPEPA